MSEDPALLASLNLSFSAKSYSVCRWMDELECKHCLIRKKSCMFNIHEHEDVVQQRISCVTQNNEDETH